VRAAAASKGIEGDWVKVSFSLLDVCLPSSAFGDTWAFGANGVHAGRQGSSDAVERLDGPGEIAEVVEVD
jgi:hypothetical protein